MNMTQTRDNQHFTTTFLVDQTPEEVFNAVINVRGWWSQAIEGRTDRLGAEFTYHYQDVHRCTFKITEFMPGKKVVWHVVDNYFNFVKDKNEWKDTNIVFEIAKKGDKTEVRFTHVGLVPAYECYGVCSDAWGTDINGSLHNLITKDKHQPNRSGQIALAFTVDQTPQEAFQAINDVRSWWSGEVEGDTVKSRSEER